MKRASTPTINPPAGGGAVSFHELIGWVRRICYESAGDTLAIYRTHLWLLLVIPAQRMFGVCRM